MVVGTHPGQRQKSTNSMTHVYYCPTMWNWSMLFS